ncbi:hypothetical protein B857_02664 [Solibacillus isronensis B3W22]|uniref:DUF4279 domain-containing protein n=1 Tax=Solibacillus isronensis B3W22 TaxID=1224748 RepID=K1KXC6_9BACL|nr:DUF4279 domain-containing protein [Solibacillus isronensis]AMO85407.1 hypothetical protein SOLI23_07375 [Solibacillus silvestris]EKB44562.1 hypothetical protein B857_02664 [Solibacillus isronensis B3W22]
MEKTSLYAYISFTGKNDVEDFPVEVVTDMLGVQPTTIFRMGERINDVRTRSFTSWQYESETIETLDTDDVLFPILNVFQYKTDTINQIKEELNLNIQIELVITMINGYTPGLVISPEFSRFASTINASIGIDMYVYPFSDAEE